MKGGSGHAQDDVAPRGGARRRLAGLRADRAGIEADLLRGGDGSRSVAAVHRRVGRAVLRADPVEHQDQVSGHGRADPGVLQLLRLPDPDRSRAVRARLRRHPGGLPLGRHDHQDLRVRPVLVRVPGVRRGWRVPGLHDGRSHLASPPGVISGRATERGNGHAARVDHQGRAWKGAHRHVPLDGNVALRMPDRPPLRMASVDIRPDDISAVAEILRSGDLRQGPVTAEFEGAFAARVGARNAVAVSSGTAALHLLYLALFEPGDEVIVPAFTLVASASMLTAIGAVPVFADVDPRTFTLDPDDVRRRITARTKGIVGVHLFGNACDVDDLRELAAEHGAAMLWDAAQALGTDHGGVDVGRHPIATCYSFYPTKIITTGEGGMVVTDDDELAEQIRLARNHGAPERYRHERLGFNYRLTDVQSALGLRQLARLDAYLERRRANARFLTDGLAGLPGLMVPFVPGYSNHSFNQYCVLVDPGHAGVDRDELAGDLADQGIETAVHYPRPLHRQPMFSDASKPGSLPVSEDLSGRILALPVHPKLERADLDYVVRAVAAALAH